MPDEDLHAGIRARFVILFDTIALQEKLTAKSLCELLDIQQPHLSEYRKGTKRVPLEKLIQICELYDYDLTHLITGVRHKGKPIPPKPPEYKVVRDHLSKDRQKKKM